MEREGEGRSVAPRRDGHLGSRLARTLAALAWALTLAMGVATLWVVSATDFLVEAGRANGASPSPEDLLLVALLVAYLAITLGYATVGAVLTGRGSGGRIGALLLAGGALFALVPFGYVVGGRLAGAEPGSILYSALLLLGPVAIGPAYSTIIPALAVAFPDGRLLSGRWRAPVIGAVVVVVIATALQLLRPGPLVGGPPNGPRNPFGVQALADAADLLAGPLLALGILAFTGLGVAAVLTRYRRGTTVERQQQRWFLAAVALAAVPLALSALPSVGGPGMALVAAVGLLLVPIAVGVAVTRYRLYEIDHLIHRTLVYVPLTAVLAGLYAATVTLLHRGFQGLTGDRSDAAIIITTLILASVFTPIRKWLEAIVDRRFKPVSGALPVIDEAIAWPAWDARMAAVALRVVRSELDARATAEGRARLDP